MKRAINRRRNQAAAFTGLESLEGRQMLTATLEWLSYVTNYTTAISGASAVTTDSSGNTYLLGYATGNIDVDPTAASWGMSKVGGYHFVAKYNSSGAVAWAYQLSSALWGGGIAADNSGNVFVTGNFYGTADFNHDTGTSNGTSNGDNDVYILSLSALNGDFQAKAVFGGTGMDSASGIAIDGNGNVVVAGQFTGTVDFDPGAGTTSLASGSATSAFVATYSGSNLSFESVRGFMSTNEAIFNNVAVAPDGGLVAVGGFRGSVDADPGAGTTTLTTAENTRSAMAVKLNSDGTLAFAAPFIVDTTSTSSNPYADLSGIAFDSEGNLFVSGAFNGQLDVDPSGTTVNLSTTSFVSNPWVESLTSAGAYRWGYNLAAEGEARAVAVTDTNGEADGGEVANFVGYFAGSNVDFQPGNGTTKLTASGQGGDAFVWTLNTAGTLNNAFNIGGTDYDDARAVAATFDKSAFVVAGVFDTSADFQPGTASAVRTTNSEITTFIAQYSPVGNGIPAGSVDLTVSALGTDITLPTSMLEGTAAKGTIPFTVKNLGPDPIPAGAVIDIRIIARNTSTYEDTILAILENQSVAGLAANASKLFKPALTLPASLPAGTYAYVVSIDINDEVIETVNYNNGTYIANHNVTVAPAYVDLTAAVSSSKLPTATISGSGAKISLPVTVKNEGNSPLGTTAVADIAIYARLANAENSAGDILVTTLANQSVAKLASGKTKTFNATVLLPTSVTTGSYRLVALVDAGEEVAESNEENNTALSDAAKPIAVTQGFIDLSVTGLTAKLPNPVPTTKATKTTFAFSVVNNGNIALSKGQLVDLAVRLRLVSGLSDDTVLAALENVSLSALGAGKSKKISTSITIPASTPAGTYRLVALADTSNDVAETNEENNTGVTADFTIGNPEF